MPNFQCSVCSKAFEVPQAALDKYPGWQPKHCREHSKQRSAREPQLLTQNTEVGGVGRGRTVREENLTIGQVLSKYSGGPESGVFTDGSAAPNPGPGGWGVVWVESGEILGQKHGYDPDTTNNRMELTAVLEALRSIPEGSSAQLFSDSQYVVKGMSQWVAGWQKRNWRKADGKPVLNDDIWKRLVEIASSRKIQWNWVEAHAGQVENERCDALANRAIDEAP